MKPELEFTICGNVWAYRPQSVLTLEEKQEAGERFDRLLEQVEAACCELV